MERFLRYDQILCRKVAPRENPEKQAKKWNFLISASKYQKYTKFTSRYMFLWMTNAMQLVKISLGITKGLKIQDGHQLWLKIVFGIRQAARYPNYEIWLTPLHT